LTPIVVEIVETGKRDVGNESAKSK